jgi:hypothetical protein
MRQEGRQRITLEGLGRLSTPVLGSLPEPAAVDRVPLRQGTGTASNPEPKAPAGWALYTEHDYVDGC